MNSNFAFAIVILISTIVSASIFATPHTIAQSDFMIRVFFNLFYKIILNLKIWKN